jgi:thiosulfate dehydrogenase [quinone] large subunit
LIQPAPFSKEMLDYLGIMMQRGRMSGFYHRFLETIVVPNAKLFSYLVLAGELTAGIGMLTGTLTRMSAFIACLLFLNYMFSKGRWFWSPDSEDAAVFFIALVLLLGKAGRSFGIDRFLAAKWPDVILW